MEDIVWNDAKGHDLNDKDFEESSWKMSLLKHWWWCWCWCWWWGQMWVLLGVKCIQSFVIQDEFSTFMHLIQELNWIHYCSRNTFLGNIVEPFLDIWAPGNSNFKKFCLKSEVREVWRYFIGLTTSCNQLSWVQASTPQLLASVYKSGNGPRNVKMLCESAKQCKTVTKSYFFVDHFSNTPVPLES